MEPSSFLVIVVLFFFFSKGANLIFSRGEALIHEHLRWFQLVGEVLTFSDSVDAKTILFVFIKGHLTSHLKRRQKRNERAL